MKVSVFGLGYVGSVTAACLARAGHRVIGVDTNEQKVAMIRDGRSPIVEKGLGPLLEEVVGDGRLTATTDTRAAVAQTDLALICVGTPSTDHGRPDFDAIARVGREIGEGLSGRDASRFTAVLRSTVLPGTTESILAPALRAGLSRAEGGRSVDVAVNPEFMREGSSLADFDMPPFVLVGASTPSAANAVRELYAQVDAPVVEVPIRTAELVKYASNAFHALKICFANEMGDIAAALGADAGEVMRVFALDRKLNISDAYLRPGYAFGGSCLPKDVRALLWAARTHDIEVPLLSSVWPSNTGQIQAAIDRVRATHRRRIGVVGLAFKAGTDDLRESPVVTLVEALIGKGLDVRVLDSNVALARLMGANQRYIETEIPHIASLMCNDVADVVAHAEVLVIGSTSDEAMRAKAAAGPDCVIIDLTRSNTSPDRVAAETDEEICVSAS